MNLLDVITDEQILNIALTHVCERDEDQIDPAAERICVFYAMKQLVDAGNDDPTDEEVKQKYSEMIVDRTLVQLINKGLVNVVFDDNIDYKLTDVGKEMLNGN